MDAQTIAEKFEYLQADLNTLMDHHSSDFLYFTNWMRDLDKKVQGFEATLLKYEKTQKFAEAMKDAVSPPVIIEVEKVKVSKLNLALAVGAGVYIGFKVNQVYQTRQSKKEQ